MRLQEAQKLAQEIVKQILPHCERVEIVGSVRRRRKSIRDLDFILIPKPFLWHRIIATLQRTMEAEVLKRGESIAQLTIKGVNVDLYVATEQTWGIIRLLRTGSMASNIRLSKRALSMGMKLSHKGLVHACKIIASTEKEIFEALGLRYIPPEERE